jgi:hypothetical protein
MLLGVLALLVASCGSDANPIFGAPASNEGTGPVGLPLDTEGQTGSTTPSATGDTSTGGSTATTSGDFGFGDLPTGSTDAYRPVPVREGLGTLDNYEWHMELATVGPTTAERMSVVTEWSYNSEPLSHYSSITTTNEGPDYDGVESSTTEIYRVENDTCQFDGEDWTYTGATDQQREVLDVAQRLLDFTIVPENPVEVGQESVAGIPATHWRYSVAGFGADSGALVTANQVDYWVANDSGILLSYSMVIESRSGPTTDTEAEVYRVETSMNLTSANTFVPIDLPSDCLAAKAESEADG